MVSNLFLVKSKTKEDVLYAVNMIIDRCECFAGKEGPTSGININCCQQSLHHSFIFSQSLILYSEKFLWHCSWEKFKKFYLWTLASEKMEHMKGKRV